MLQIINFLQNIEHRLNFFRNILQKLWAFESNNLNCQKNVFVMVKHHNVVIKLWNFEENLSQIF